MVGTRSEVLVDRAIRMVFVMSMFAGFARTSIPAALPGLTDPASETEETPILRPQQPMPPGSCVLPLPPPDPRVRIPFIVTPKPWEFPGFSIDVSDPPGFVWNSDDVRDLVLVDIPVGGVGDDETFRTLVNSFMVEASTRGLCLLAHHLHVQATRRHGTVWRVDGVPYAALVSAMETDPSPERRAFALVALSKSGGSPWSRLVNDPDPWVRAAAARWLHPPNDVTESEAAQVVASLFELMRSDHVGTRAVAARAVGPWIHDESQNATLIAIAETDPDVYVRGCALEGLTQVRSLPARAITRRYLNDPSVDPALREAARLALEKTGIRIETVADR